MHQLIRGFIALTLLLTLLSITLPNQAQSVLSTETMSLERFVLLDAVNDRELFEINDGDIITLDDLPVSSADLNILVTEAPNSALIGSVAFGLNRIQRLNVENIAPFTLYRNKASDYFPGRIVAGDYILTATPYTLDNAGGVAGQPLVVRFRVVEAPRVRTFTLVNATTDLDVVNINNGDTLNFDELSLLPTEVNIRANVDPAQVGSMAFALTGPVSRTHVENIMPYALFQDMNGDYFGGRLDPGNYQLTATPYSGSNATGNPGIPLTVNFNVIYEPPDEAPFVVSTSPTNGAEFVPTDSPIILTFSEPVLLAVSSPAEISLPYIMRRQTISGFTLVCSSSGTRQLADFSLDTVDQVTYTLTPTRPLLRGESCTATVNANGVFDVDLIDPPDTMLDNTVFSFTVGDPADTAPFVQSTTPDDGAGDVSPRSNITVDFSEPVILDRLWFSLSCTRSGTRTTGGFFVQSVTETAYNLIPVFPLTFDETCTGTVFANAVRDVDTDDPPDTMLADFTFSFNTIRPADQAPAVISTSPTNGTTDVPVDAILRVQFSEAVTVRGDWFTVSCTTSGDRAANAFNVTTVNNINFNLTPLTAFASDETCTATVVNTGVSDVDTNDPPDNPIASSSFTFATQALDDAPFITMTTPANGAADVTPNTPISLTFSEPVDVSGNWFTLVCNRSGSRNINGFSVTSADNVTFQLRAIFPLTENETCTGTVVAANVVDSDLADPQDNMIRDLVFTFSTVIPVDTAPFVVSSNPANGTTGVTVNPVITLTFSEPVTTAGEWFGISCSISGTRLGDALSITTVDQTTYTITPLIPFALGERCNAGAGANNISDVDTNDPPDKMLADFTFSFSIQQDAAPSVFSTSPNNGATNVLQSADILVAFSEPVNAPNTAFTITCTSGTRTFALNTTDSVVFTLNPTVNFSPGDSCTLFIDRDFVTDLDTLDPADNMASDVTINFTVRN